jgi:hypothetical protein
MNEASTMNATEEEATIACKDSEAVYSATANACPMGLKLVLIGDSITRYLYLSLAYFCDKANGLTWNRSHQPMVNLNQKQYLRKVPAHLGLATLFRESNQILSPLE